MTLDWNAEGDFDEVVDSLENLVWKRVCVGDERWIQAWRFSESSGEAPSGREGIRVDDAVWQLPFEEGESSPAPGDTTL